MSTEAGKQFKGTHYISISDREKMEVRGVTDVVSFDESAVVLSTVEGVLAIEGEGLHIKQRNMESREFGIEGKIHALSYPEGRPRPRGFRKRGESVR